MLEQVALVQIKWWAEESELIKRLQTNQVINRRMKIQRARYSSSLHSFGSRD